MDSTKTTAITNVRVFDGRKLTNPTTVAFSNGRIVPSSTKADIQIDGQGHSLLPGLIDAHCHVFDKSELGLLAKAGVTTALDMGSFPVDKVHSFRNQKGLTDYHSAGVGLTAPGSHHSKLAGMPTEAMVTSADGGRQFVRDRVKEGMDYIKLIVDHPGPTQEVIDAACDEAKKVGKLSICHAPSFEAVRMAQEAKCDFVTHVMLDAPITEDGVMKMVQEKRGLIPTLTIMEVVHQLGIPGNDYRNCEESVRAMHQAGVTILAGTDANAVPGSPAHVHHGESMVRELELLVQAGLSNGEALRAATSETSKCFGFKDRGAIETGLRADMMLVEGDPTQDMSAVKHVLKVWCSGIEVLQ